MRAGVDYTSVPARHMADVVERWIEHGVPGGSFLMAVVTNDLREAAARSDDTNRHLLFEWVAWFHNNAPIGSWGSPEAARQWMTRHAEQRED